MHTTNIRTEVLFSWGRRGGEKIKLSDSLVDTLPSNFAGNHGCYMWPYIFCMILCNQPEYVKPEVLSKNLALCMSDIQ